MTRFKKLKRNVAVSLAIFILVTGSIIAIGLISHQEEQEGKALVIGVPVYTVKDGGVLIQPAATQTQTNIQTNTETNTQPTNTQTVTIVDSGIRTRAS